MLYMSMDISGLLGVKHSVVPAFGWYVPGSQGVQAVPLPEGLTVPGAQALHAPDGVST
jgi:hypothetical protein